MAWWDVFRLWVYATSADPLSQRARRDQLTSAGVSSPDLPDIRQDGSYTGGQQGMIRLRDSNDFIDLSSVTNRQSRYKEYERLRSVPEIENAMTVIADEACISGDTKISTLFHGPKSIKKLTEDYDGEPFLVYCYDFEKQDYSLGWAYDPRFIKKARTVRIMLDDGSHYTVTPDHKILMRSGQWKEAGQIQFGDELMPFHRVMEPNKYFNIIHKNVQPRIFTFQNGWMNERTFIEEWRTGKPQTDALDKKIIKLFSGGMTKAQTAKAVGRSKYCLYTRLLKHGMTAQELQRYTIKKDRRRVVGRTLGPEIDVYDLSVQDHKNFCTETTVMHNCQRDDHGNIIQVECGNKEVKKELEFLLLNRKMLNLNRRMWDLVKKVCIFGDYFYELVLLQDEPKAGVQKIVELPADSIYRIETVKGKLVEFQQSKEGPDYQSLARAEVTKATDADLMQATAIRFAPQQIIHFRIGDDRRTFYPYGQSLIEPARGPAHQLRLAEDGMLVYRLCLTGDVKVKTSAGWKCMRDIKPGDGVFVLNNDLNLVESKVLYHINNGVKPVFKVISDHNEITGTATHPVLVKDLRSGEIEYIDIIDIVPNRHQFVCELENIEEPKKINRFYKEIYAHLTKGQKDLYKQKTYAKGRKKELVYECLNVCGIEENKHNVQRIWSFLNNKDTCAVDLELADTVCSKFKLSSEDLVLHNKDERNAERVNLPECINEELAELLGFLFGDGGVTKRESSGVVWFAAGDIPELNEKYSSILRKYFSVCLFSQDKRKNDGIGVYRTSSITAADIFNNLGLSGDCYTKRVPNWLFRERKEIRKAFVKGFADADGQKRGMKCKTWNTTIRLANKLFVEDIQQLWRSLGLHCSEVKKIDENKSEICGVEVQKSTGWEIYISETIVPKYDTIKLIESAGEEEVYDITVDHDEHNFVANNVIVHNSRAPERRVFYIDVGQMPQFRAEAYMDRIKDQFRKKKMATSRNGQVGASAVEERWHPPAADEDYWVPVRPNSQTRVDTLPGATNLDQIADVGYFRNKLFTALNFPKNYFNNDDINVTRIALSAQDIKFARMIERIQGYVIDGIIQIAERHLELRGFPEESYDDLMIQMTPPSAWKELTNMEVTQGRINNVSSLKSSMMMSDFDLLTRWMKYPEEDAKEIIARNKIQKLEDLKLQIIGQNPQLLGMGMPSNPGEPEMGAEPGGPNPMLNPEGEQPPPNPEQGGGEPPVPEGGEQQPGKKKRNAMPLPQPSPEDIERYDLGVEDYSREQDVEDIDFSEG